MKSEKPLIAFLLILCLLIVSFGIWVLVKYGGKPITEVPLWVLWMFQK